MRVFIITTVFLLSAGLGFCAELYLPKVSAKSGDTIGIPLKIDTADNLAGIKVVLNFDPRLFTYSGGEKTEFTSPLMHVVNDRTPGIVILVMAGAKGISGKDIPLFLLKFKVAKNLRTTKEANFAITGAELMNDDLKPVECTTRTNGILVAPE